MKFELVSKTRNRARFRANFPFGYEAGEKLADRLDSIVGIEGTLVNPRTRSVLIIFASELSYKTALNVLKDEAPNLKKLPLSIPKGTSVISDVTFWPTARYFVIGPLLPPALRLGLFVHTSRDIFLNGFKKMFSGQLTVEVLDMSALTIALLMRDFKTATTLTLLLGLGEGLQDWTRRKTMANLTRSLALNIDTVWVLRGKTEIEVPLSTVTEKDIVIVRTGSAIPVDGTIVRGEGMVNQASMTGEPLPVLRGVDSTVFAGSVLEEGEIYIAPTGVGENTRLSKIIHFIENSEKTKANVEASADRLADKVVPYSFLLAGIVWILTRNLARVASVLMVDYSCAIKIATPVAFLSAMKEAANRRILIKGGKYLEALSIVDTVVFDKTGTLTQSSPKLKEVISLNPKWSEDNILKLAACLEEHFPHPVAKAVVKAAADKHLHHEEEHAEVQYIVGHGICSQLDGLKLLIGSRHYIEDDEKIKVDFAQPSIDKLASRGQTVLYFAVGDELVGLLGIEDPIRAESKQVIEKLKKMGIAHIVMITGDGPKTAANVAKRLGITEYYCQVLPDGKADIVKKMENEGRKVLMIGDGINDSPALSAATVGISLSDGADLAREVASVVLLESNLMHLPLAIELGRKTIKRIHENFLASISLNSVFLGTGLVGILPPAAGAVLHNMTTVGVTLNASRAKLQMDTTDYQEKLIDEVAQEEKQAEIYKRAIEDYEKQIC